MTTEFIAACYWKTNSAWIVKIDKDGKVALVHNTKTSSRVQLQPFLTSLLYGTRGVARRRARGFAIRRWKLGHFCVLPTRTKQAWDLISPLFLLRPYCQLKNRGGVLQNSLVWKRVPQTKRFEKHWPILVRALDGLRVSIILVKDDFFMWKVVSLICNYLYFTVVRRHDL